MKFAILLVSVLLNVLQLEGQSDSIKIKQNSINIEVGYPTSIFIDKYSNLTLNQKNLYKPFKEYLPPFLFKITFTRKDLLIVSLNYRYFEKNTTVDNRKQGEVTNRVFHAFDFGVGKRFLINNFYYQPSLFISTRPSGMQRVLLDYIPGGWNEPITTAYKYNSIGYGCGINIQKTLYHCLNVSFETMFNHYFEKNNIIGKKIAGFDEFYKTYNVNKNILTFVIKLGYEIKFKKQKPSL